MPRRGAASRGTPFLVATPWALHRDGYDVTLRRLCGFSRVVRRRPGTTLVFVKSPDIGELKNFYRLWSVRRHGLRRKPKTRQKSTLQLPLAGA